MAQRRRWNDWGRVNASNPIRDRVDSNNSPDGIDYVIPGNDDSIRAIQIYIQGAADAVDEGRSAMAQISGTKEDEFVEVSGEAAQ